MCDEDQFLLDLWDQGLDCDVTSISSLMKSQESENQDECYEYPYGELSDDEEEEEDDDDDESSDFDSDSSSDSDSDSDEESDSDDDSDDDDDSGDDETLIKPIDRQLRTARPIRIQLLKRQTLLQALETELPCCGDNSVGFWIWLTSRDVYRDFV